MIDDKKNNPIEYDGFYPIRMHVPPGASGFSIPAITHVPHRYRFCSYMDVLVCLACGAYQSPYSPDPTSCNTGLRAKNKESTQ
jgi:hypothetical protein